MAHPPRFDSDDPVLARLREICLALPEADEKVSHGRPNFFTKKIFAGYGAVIKGDHHSDRYAQSLIFMPNDDDLAAYDQDDRFFVPAYWGPHGWRGFDLSGRSGPVDWTEVAELVEDSYRNTAPTRLVTDLDAPSMRLPTDRRQGD